MSTQQTFEQEIEDGTVLEGALVASCPNPMEILSRAVDQGMSVETIEKLMELSQRWDAARAKESYASAMRACQQDMPVVVRDAYNKQTQSKYAKLENVINRIKETYTKHGFALSFGTLDCEAADHVRIYCDCIHEHGHIERVEGNFPLDGAGFKGTANKTGIQAMGSTLSYARRYLTLLLFNVSVADEDNDGQGHQELIDEKDIAAINKALDRFPPGDDKAALEGLLRWLGIEDLSQMPKSRLQEAIKALHKKADKEVPA